MNLGDFTQRRNAAEKKKAQHLKVHLKTSLHVYIFKTTIKTNWVILHRLTGMLIRRPFFFFGIFFELAFVDSINVLPIFFSLFLKKQNKNV